MRRTMAARPIVFVMANPDPEIAYEDVLAALKDALMCTGRTDYPNQMNNVMGFPFIFPGALDVCATAINEEMKLAATQALASLAKKTCRFPCATRTESSESASGPSTSSRNRSIHGCSCGRHPLPSRVRRWKAQ
jgi:malic enzyme